MTSHLYRGFRSTSRIKPKTIVRPAIRITQKRMEKDRVSNPAVDRAFMAEPNVEMPWATALAGLRSLMITMPMMMARLQ